MELLLNQVSIYGFTYCFGQVFSKVIITEIGSENYIRIALHGTPRSFQEDYEKNNPHPKIIPDFLTATWITRCKKIDHLLGFTA